MRKAAFLATLSILAVLSGIGAVHADYVYTTISVPGASATQAFGISGSNIVGVYTATDATSHAFLYNGSIYTTLDVPGTWNSQCLAIDGSNIVGSYRDATGKHGFLYNGSTYTALDVPEGQVGRVDRQTWATGISGSKIVGGAASFDTYRLGFIYDGSTYVTFHAPGTETEVHGVDGDKIVGASSSGNMGFVYDGFSFTYLDAGAIPYDISGNNIVGNHGSFNHQTGGAFLYDGSTYTALNVPGALTTLAYGIDGNNIVGSYTDAEGMTRGFFATSVAAPIPGAILLLAPGLAGVVAIRRRPRK